VQHTILYLQDSQHEKLAGAILMLQTNEIVANIERPSGYMSLLVSTPTHAS